MVRGEMPLSMLTLMIMPDVLRAMLNDLAICRRKLARWLMVIQSDLMLFPGAFLVFGDAVVWGGLVQYAGHWDHVHKLALVGGLMLR